ncbi:MAG: bifunctional methylenetetrahydrofolate dehydrogenase/methenyltetrahydrofolate cyclohydrolase, partial [Betaproteobacteria bacterium]|nr:bifunctional methylenetetrahydrofolate dehydrogenase/methenyltetrahydrofolate cyclohydrolase [Betaproteobacteria bacterium]
MSAQLIDGNALSTQLRAQIAARVGDLTARGLTPGLAVILVGD